MKLYSWCRMVSILKQVVSLLLVMLLLVPLGAATIGSGDKQVRRAHQVAVPQATKKTVTTADLNSLDLVAVLSRLDVHMSWNSLLEQAVFSRGPDNFVVQTSYGSGILNGKKLFVMPPDGINPASGRVSLAGYETLSTVFPPPSKLEGMRRIKTIFIDPGHGGKDPGTIGHFMVNGKMVQVYEKDVVLSVSLQLRNLLRARYPDKNIVMSRETDIYLPLDERTRLANKYSQSRDESTIYISIHANASPNTRGKGFEVWYLPPEYRRQLIAEDDVQISDKSVLPLINSIVEEEYTVESIILARNVLNGIDAATSGQTVNRGLKAEEWYVVRSARMPSILVEVGFVSNADDFRLLNTPGYLRKLAEGIYNGLSSFIVDYENVSSK